MALPFALIDNQQSTAVLYNSTGDGQNGVEKSAPEMRHSCGFKLTDRSRWYSLYRRREFNKLGQRQILDKLYQNSSGILSWAGRVYVTSLSTLPVSWYTAGHNERHFLAHYIQTVGDREEVLII